MWIKWLLYGCLQSWQHIISHFCRWNLLSGCPNAAWIILTFDPAVAAAADRAAGPGGAARHPPAEAVAAPAGGKSISLNRGAAPHHHHPLLPLHHQSTLRADLHHHPVFRVHRMCFRCLFWTLSCLSNLQSHPEKSWSGNKWVWNKINFFVI